LTVCDNEVYKAIEEGVGNALKASKFNSHEIYKVYSGDSFIPVIAFDSKVASEIALYVYDVIESGEELSIKKCFEEGITRYQKKIEGMQRVTQNVTRLAILKTCENAAQIIDESLNKPNPYDSIFVKSHGELEKCFSKFNSARSTELIKMMGTQVELAAKRDELDR
jgi:hypothetical protein